MERLNGEMELLDSTLEGAVETADILLVDGDVELLDGTLEGNIASADDLPALMGELAIQATMMVNPPFFGVSEEFVIDEDGILHIQEVPVSKIDGLDALLSDTLVGVSAGGTLLSATDRIADIPVATLVELGLVRSSADENAVSVGNSGTMTVNSLNVNRLTQTAGERFTLNAGDSTD